MAKGFPGRGWWISRRARPDWAYEFPDPTGPDTKICRTGPAGPDWIRTYTFQHFTHQVRVIYSQIWCHKLLNLINKQKKSWKKIWLFFFFLFSRGFTVRRPGRKTSGFRTVRILKICRTSGPDVMSGRALSGTFIFFWGRNQVYYACCSFKGRKLV